MGIASMLKRFHGAVCGLVCWGWGVLVVCGVCFCFVSRSEKRLVHYFFQGNVPVAALWVRVVLVAACWLRRLAQAAAARHASSVGSLAQKFFYSPLYI